MRAALLPAALCCLMTAAAAPPPPSTEHVIEMARMRFGPAPANLKVGDTIVWLNRDIVPHTATARDRSFDVTIQSRKSVRVTVRRAGTIAIYCRFHPAMKGVLRVAAR